jgi:hypothetical protein
MAVVEPITRREESYRLWCVFLYDLETSCMRRPWPTGGLSFQETQNTMADLIFPSLKMLQMS